MTQPFGPTIQIGRLHFTAVGFDEAVEAVLQAAHKSEALPIRLSNAYCVAIAERDHSYAELLGRPGITLPDGTPVAWLMQRLARRATFGSAKIQLIRGPSFFESTLLKSADSDVRHFFLGTSDSTITALRTAVERLHEAIIVAGAYAPPFGPVDDAFVEEAQMKISRSGANLVWVALGTPKQDYAAERLARALDLPVAAVGAAFDFTAGSVKQAPGFLRGSGFEWLFRLAQDPKRLWRRYAAGNAIFLMIAFRAVFGFDRPTRNR